MPQQLRRISTCGLQQHQRIAANLLGCASFMAAFGFALVITLRCRRAFSEDVSLRSIRAFWLFSLVLLRKLKVDFDLWCCCGRAVRASATDMTADDASPKDRRLKVVLQFLFGRFVKNMYQTVWLNVYTVIEMLQ